MTIKIIQVFSDKEHEKRISEIFKEHNVLDCYFENLSKSKVLARAFVSSEKTEEVLDVLESYFSENEDYRIVVLPVEASIPREKKSKEKEEEKNNQKNASRISREELYANISRNTGLSKVYLFLIAISSLIAALGILSGNFVVIIGAMIIAPLLGPNIALALATTLADADLAKKSIKTIIAGIVVALAISSLVGFFLNINPSSPEIASRTVVSFTDIAIALASGSVGVIAFTAGYFLTSLMGVMIAVALLPPLVVLGILLGAGLWQEALLAFLLLMVNFVCINLAGVATFIAFKVRPRTWWEVDKAKQASRLALSLWLALLLALGFLILLIN